MHQLIPHILALFLTGSNDAILFTLKFFLWAKHFVTKFEVMIAGVHCTDYLFKVEAFLSHISLASFLWDIGKQ